MSIPRREGLRNIIGMVRPVNALITSVGVWIGWAVATGDPFHITVPLVLTIISSIFLIGGGNIFNDIGDIEIDRKIHPERALPSGKLKRQLMVRIGLLFWVTGVIFTSIACLMVSTYLPLLITIIALSLLLVYEICAKKIGLMGNITVSLLTGVPFLFGSSLTGDIPTLVLMFSIMACLVNLSRELLKDVQDMEGDVEIRKTFPLLHSKGSAMNIAKVSVLSGVFVSYLVLFIAGFEIMYLVLITISDILFIIAIFRSRDDIDGSVDLLKTGMGVALIAFFIWSIV